MTELITFINYWQTLIGSIIGGIFALSVAFIVAYAARRREEVASGMLLTGDVAAIRCVMEALEALARHENVPEDEYYLWFSEKLVCSYPTLSPLFDASLLRLMPVNHSLAAHLCLMRKIYSEVLMMVERLSQDYKSFHEHGKTIRAQDHFKADARLVTRHFHLAARHASCAEYLISNLVLSSVPTWHRIRRLVWSRSCEKECHCLLREGHANQGLQSIPKSVGVCKEKYQGQTCTLDKFNGG